MSQHTDHTSLSRIRNALVVFGTALVASSVVPADAASVVGNSLQQSSLISAFEHTVSIIGVVFFIIAGIINNTLVKRLGFKLTEVVGLPGL
ncbi:hypothetical protein [Corynebacterium sp. HS2168-gen11]|uniref:hypothetical protein n=1 Tax=Corynebacterium sp. HS2168-gen11 TaxID=2974027 RepID=UPI00216B2123|nr:hypothetical protein [Corynebacterium sp. HS2168-gen11]MCS4536476.1 hypothetical protein [Corynebacterium sp. HS2168-gen11]